MSNDGTARHLVIVLGDQLDRASSAFDGFDPGRDTILMAEARSEATHVRSHKARIVLFLSAMRHFRDDRVGEGIRVDYTGIDDAGAARTLGAAVIDGIRRNGPRRLVVTEPGEWRVREELLTTAREAGVPLDIRQDTRFLCSREEFAAHARGRKQLRMEFFYREMRRRHKVLMDGDRPVGGEWNFDSENRGSFGRQGPGRLPLPPSFPPDATTRRVIGLVEHLFPGHPGSLANFDWPVTPADARRALADFVRHRLPGFGARQDAMWSGEPFLQHSLLSSSMNLGLLSPREVVEAAETAWKDDPARYPLASVEGFVRQVLGWREYVRGVYWLLMPGYLDRNELGADRPLPSFYWSGNTRMRCLAEAIGQTLEHGYAHHIQRLMVTGLYALLLGVRPRELHEWYLAVYVDAVEWVELPNTLGMSQYADGGVMSSKPYVATGRYIDRMSDYCGSCPYDPKRSTGDGACPFTTLYWGFLMRHRKRLENNPRMKLQVRNLDRLDRQEMKGIHARAERLRGGEEVS